MSNLANPHVIKVMRTEIARVEKEVWRGQPDRVCDATTQRKQRTRHEDSSFQQAELCRQTYLTTARARLERYRKTGEILSVSAPTQLAF